MSTVVAKPLHYAAKVTQDNVLEFSKVENPIVGEGTPLEAFAHRLRYNQRFGK